MVSRGDFIGYEQHVRTSNGANYGDVYCNTNQTGHHYAGDTGTYSYGKIRSTLVSGSLNMYMYEEW